MIKNRRKAYEDGEKTYFNGKPCGRGHTLGRYTASGNCIECGRLANFSFSRVIMCERMRAYEKQIVIKVMDARDEQAIIDFADAINEARHITNGIAVAAHAAALRAQPPEPPIHWNNEGHL